VTPDELLAELWRDYVALAPQAARIHALLEARGEQVRNDHVALRTFGLPRIDVTALATTFELCGWIERDRYRFADKKLDARYWQHPDPELPKVFISELCMADISPRARAIITGLIAQLEPNFGTGEDGIRVDLPWAGRPWRVTRAEYETLLAESEYAAWVAAFGFRVNHFTVDVNALRTFDGLPALDDFLVGNGFQLNTSGGAIKGTPADLLEQSSTLADSIAVDLGGETVQIPSVYYEFAKRYAQPDGELFQGFVPASADKIFESTDVKR
jgi:hypothetical protein